MSSITEICNQALDIIGSKRINNYETDTSPEAIRCRIHYQPTLLSYLRSYDWNFAKKRATLTADATAPTFEYKYAYLLPSDFLRLAVDDNYPAIPMEMEDGKILSDESPMEIKYIRKVSDPTQMEPCFVEALVLKLAIRMLVAVAGLNTNTIRSQLKDEYNIANGKARIISFQEDNISGESKWVQSRYYNQSGLDPSHL